AGSHMLGNEGHRFSDGGWAGCIPGDQGICITVGRSKLKPGQQLLPASRLQAARPPTTRIDIHTNPSRRVSNKVGMTINQAGDVVLVISNVKVRSLAKPFAGARLPATHFLRRQRWIRTKNCSAAGYRSRVQIKHVRIAEGASGAESEIPISRQVIR